jgi:hypothetical protein
VTSLGPSHQPARRWIKGKNPAAPAVKREAEEDWGRRFGKKILVYLMRGVLDDSRNS